MKFFFNKNKFRYKKLHFKIYLKLLQLNYAPQIFPKLEIMKFCLK
jgi:hypothetical protein